MRARSFGFILCLLLGSNLFTNANSQTTWQVPNHVGSIPEAIDSSATGDIILVTQSYTENGRVLVSKDVTITRSDGVVATIQAGSLDDYAVKITADGAVVEKFVLKAGSSPTGIVQINSKSEVRDCTLQDNGNLVTLAGASLYAGAKLSNCTMSLTSGQPKAVYIGDSNSTDRAQVLNNDFNIAVTSARTADQAIYVAGGTHAVIQGNILSFSGASASEAIGMWVESGQNYCLIDQNTLSTGYAGIDNEASYTTLSENIVEDFTYGVRLFSGNDITMENNTIVRASCASTTYGFWTGIGLQNSTLDFSNNLVENTDTGFLFNTAVGGSWTISHNAYWTDSPTCGTGSNRTLTTSQLREDLEPLFCASHEFTQRIDSGIAKGNNPWGELVGALPVTCMYGTLQRDSEYTEGGTLAFTGDTVVPNSIDLTLGAGTILNISDSDPDSTGSDTQKVELIVESGGTLTIEGTSGTGNAVQFSSTGAEGDWYGVHVKQGGSASIEYADFQDATQAIVYQGTGTGSISNCKFSNNEVLEIWAGSGYGMDLTIAHNILTVGGGSGISWDVDVTGAAVDTNEITGSSSSSAGIKENALTGGAIPTYTGNTISGFSNGSGIRNSACDAVMVANTISGCYNGIEIVGGSPVIGQQDDEDSDNILSTNTYGILCSGGTPVIRNNQITSNFVGVVATNGAAPDMGTNGTTDAGNNTLTGNNICIANLNGSGTLDAQGNFFGEAVGCPGPTCTYGSVDVDNWQCTEPAGVQVAMGPLEPKGFRLLGAGPNPMAGAGKIYFSLEDGEARVHGQVFDISGRVVRDLGETVAGRGTHVLDWDGRSDVGNPVQSGIYFVRVKATNGFQGTTKVLVTR